MSPMEELKDFRELELEENSPGSSNIFNLTIERFNAIVEMGMDLNMIFILECLNEGTDPSIHMKSDESERIEAWKQTLSRKGLIVDNKLTLIGIGILNSLKGDGDVIGVIKDIVIKKLSDFDKWWDAFPRTDLFTYQGKEFNGSRGMRVKKDDCRKKFLAVLDEGEYSAEDMIRALEYEVLLKKQESFKEKDNKLKYMHNSHTYLLQRDFENFIEISKVKRAEAPKTSGTFDI